MINKKVIEAALNEIKTLADKSRSLGEIEGPDQLDHKSECVGLLKAGVVLQLALNNSIEKYDTTQ